MNLKKQTNILTGNEYTSVKIKVMNILPLALRAANKQVTNLLGAE